MKKYKITSVVHRSGFMLYGKAAILYKNGEKDIVVAEEILKKARITKIAKNWATKIINENEQKSNSVK